VNLELYLAFVLATTVMILLPGPSVMLTVSHSLAFGPGRALVTVTGAVLGVGVQLALTVIGMTSLMLLLADGFEVLRRIRAAGTKSPVLMLTARDEEVDKVIGLELGADDYLTKPFGLRELMSRIRALLRRAYGDLADAAGGRVIRHGDLLIDLDRRRVQRGQRRISLTPTEFEILRHLASKPGRVYTRAELLDLLRDYEALDQDEKTINVHVSHLRDKLEDDPGHPAFVQTVRGVGYAFAER